MEKKIMRTIKGDEDKNSQIGSIESPRPALAKGFTRGPWQAIGKGDKLDGGSSKKHPCFNGRIVAANGERIVSTSSLLGVTGATPKEAEANARLIAAAPSLYDAAKFARSVLTANPMELSERMAIEKLDAALALCQRSEGD